MSTANRNAFSNLLYLILQQRENKPHYIQALTKRKKVLKKRFNIIIAGRLIIVSEPR